jgi:hypothetical protein
MDEASTKQFPGPEFKFHTTKKNNKNIFERKIR